MVRLKKLFKFPTPVELGLSDRNALGMRKITPFQKGPSWEDYDDIVKMKFPIKWKLYTIVKFILDFINFKFLSPLRDLKQYLVFHLIPSKKYHMLDLRQPSNPEYTDVYDYGFIDESSAMTYAIMNLLDKYVQNATDISDYYDLETINNDLGMKIQYDTLQEAKEIVMWWRVERKEDVSFVDVLRTEFLNLRHNPILHNSHEAEMAYKDLRRAEQDLEDKLDKMLLKAVRIRRHLW